MENRARAQHYCVSLHLVEKKGEKRNVRSKKETRNGSARGMEPVTFSFNLQ